MEINDEQITDLKKFKEFFKSEELLHLDWFSKVTWNLQDQSNPRIHFFLSPVVEKSFNSGKQYKIDLSRQVETSLGVGYLPALAIGQVYRKGVLAPRKFWPEPTTIQFELDTSISENVVNHRLGDQRGKGDYWVSHKPVGRHNWGKAYQSKFKTLHGSYLSYPVNQLYPSQQSVDVVIHEIELIAYYYASTTNLSKAAFMGHYTNDLIERKIICTTKQKPSFDTATQTGRFIYQHGFHQQDMPTIGRILFSQNQIALQGVWKIGKSIMSSPNPGIGTPFGYAETHFPFAGKTTLTLEGFWSPSKRQDQHKRTFIARRIIDCTHPYPFTRLEYRDAVDPRGEKAEGFDAESFSWPKIPKKKKVIHEGASVSDEPPSAKELTKLISRSDRKHSGLEGVDLIRLPPEKSTHQSDNPHNIEDPTPRPDQSTGDPTFGNSSSQPIKIEDEVQIEQPITRELEDFVKAILFIKKQNPKWKVSNISIGIPHLSGGVKYSNFPRVYNNDSTTPLQFSYHDKAKTKNRRFVCYEISYDDKFGYLFNGEARIRLPKNKTQSAPTIENMSIILLRTKSFGIIKPEDFSPFIKKTVKGGAWPSQENLDNFVRFHTLYPNSHHFTDIAIRIKKLIQRGLAP
jgi:hypothetical protein